MDIGAYVSHGWNTFKNNPTPFIIVTVVLAIANVAISVIGNFLPLMLGTVISLAVSGLFLGAFAQMGLKGSRGQTPELADIAVIFQRPVDYIVVGLAVSIGMLACGVGFIVTQTLFTFAMFLVLSGVGYQEALRRSLDAVKPRFTDVLLLMLVVLVLNIAGMLLCGVGMLVSIPVGFIALAKAFDDFGFGAAGIPGGIVTPPPPQQALP